MKIAIDAGHGMGNRRTGRFDTGTVFTDAEGTTFAEADITLKFALTLKEILLQNDIPFFLTRTSNADNAPVGTRARRAADAGCTHFISFHINAPETDNDPGPNGLEILFRNTTKDKPLADALLTQLIDVTGLHSRGTIRRTDLAVLRFTPGPAVLIELGFLPNARDRAFLLQRENRIAICRAIVGVLTGNNVSLAVTGTESISLAEAPDSVAAGVDTDGVGLAAPQQLVGDGTWFFTGIVDGNDIVVRDIRCTFFGGADDKEDNGITASGVVTKNHPDVMGCALPIRLPHFAKTAGSPIPKLPFGTKVRVFCRTTNRVITVPFIDVGPAKSTKHALDVTEAAFKALGVSLNDGVLNADFRIIGGAAFIGT